MKLNPIGIKPKWIIAEQRVLEIQAAIKRYEDENLTVPLEWYEEQYELCLYLVRREISKIPINN